MESIWYSPYALFITTHAHHTHTVNIATGAEVQLIFVAQRLESRHNNKCRAKIGGFGLCI